MTADRAKKKAMSLQKKVEKARSAIEEHFEKHHNITRNDLDTRLTGFSPSFAVTASRTGEAEQVLSTVTHPYRAESALPTPYALEKRGHPYHRTSIAYAAMPFQVRCGLRR
jgi:hypothetical protein